MTASNMAGMHSWAAPELAKLPTAEIRLSLHDTATDSCRDLPLGEVSLYVCGITPYDATHLGHAATYVAFDVLHRSWIDAGAVVTYIQNVTDVDDPLLERAREISRDYTDLAADQIELYRTDMAWLSVLPPTHFESVVATVGWVVEAVSSMLASGYAYRVDSDVYAHYHQASHQVATGVPADKRASIFAERGGDPDRFGKQHPLDALLWRGARDGEPHWDGGELGPGRPGWHIECAAIAARRADLPLTLQGGGSDLIFPHHEFSAQHLVDITGNPRPMPHTTHTGMVGLDGEKMSKSKGNLVFVSTLRGDGVDPRAVRLLLLNHHYRSDWEFTPDDLRQAQRRLEGWLSAARSVVNNAGAETASMESADFTSEGALLHELRRALASDLNTPRALETVDQWAASVTESRTIADLSAIETLLGISLTAI